MAGDWAAVDVGRDPAAWARLLRRAYVRAADGARPSTIVRPLVADSWARCARAGLEIDGVAPRFDDGEQADRALKAHPLQAYLTLLEEMLVGVARYAHQIALVADAEGLVLWADGHEPTLAIAERINLAPGASWHEADAGTNAIGTALALDRPVQIFSAEHFRARLHGWSSAAAPVRDPDTGERVGAVALAGPYRAAHPHGFSLVAATASVIEDRMELAAIRRRETLTGEFLRRVLPRSRGRSALVDRDGRVLAASPEAWLGSRVRIGSGGFPLPPPHAPVHVEPLNGGEGFLLSDVVDAPGPPVLRLSALGADRATAWVDGRRLRLSLRHSELLVALALHPDGLDEDALAHAVYGHPVKAVTVRAEISRLRKVLGPALRTRPYRLVADVRADFLWQSQPDLRRGALLPASHAPAVVAARRRLAEPPAMAS
jgi:hypothetical protein